MRDGLILRGVKRMTRCIMALETWLRRRLRSSRGAWQLGGACCRSGLCCEEPSIRVPAALWRPGRLRRVFLAWQRRVNGFALLRAEEPRLLVFRCTHFDHATRRCDSYGSRPFLCRDYPRALLDQAWPQLLPGCGHRAVAPNAAGLAQAIDGLALDEARKAELRRKLNLER